MGIKFIVVGEKRVPVRIGEFRFIGVFDIIEFVVGVEPWIIARSFALPVWCRGRDLEDIVIWSLVGVVSHGPVLVESFVAGGEAVPASLQKPNTKRGQILYACSVFL